jgi:uncharacterized protein YcaQ
MRPGEPISAAEARRIAIAAQALAAPRPTGRVDRRHLRALFERVALVQVDSVNVLTRSEELPVFARLGGHRRGVVRAMERDGELFEFWAHEASLLPVRFEPLLRWRMAEAAEGQMWSGLVEVQRKRPEFVRAVYDEVAARGPIRAGELTGARPKTEKWWGWNEHKRALEYLFWTGQLSAIRAANNFERHYDLRERVIPAEILAAPTPEPAVAQRALLLAAARAHGVGTARDLGDYFRLPIAAARARLDELAESGDLTRVTVEGWRDDAFADPELRRPRTVSAQALLSPFDSLIWERARTERIFDFRYRLEIYTPATKRIHGYYVLPFLFGDRLVARVDLKADRAARQLLVQAAYAEPGVDAARVAEPLLEELTAMAAWLDLDAVTIKPSGDLAPTLRRASGGR